MKLPGYLKCSNFKIIVIAWLSVEVAHERKLSTLSAGEASTAKCVQSITLKRAKHTAESELPEAGKSIMLDFLIMQAKEMSIADAHNVFKSKR